jgi:uncharacterized protein
MKQLARRSPADLMRASEADILIIPGFRGSDPEHWQSRWEAKLPSARRVLQEDWERPKLAAWRAHIVEEVARSGRPVILIAHSLGVLAAVHAAPLFPDGKVKGGFFVAPPSQKILSIFDTVDPAFLTIPKEPLTFPALLIASRNDQYASFEDSEALAKTLGTKLADAGFRVTSTAKAATAPGRKDSSLWLLF